MNDDNGGGVLPQLKFFAVSAFYLGCNFMPAIVLFAIYKVLTGSFVVGIAILFIFACDYLLPMPIPGINKRWCEMTDESQGKSIYFPAETVIECDFKKDRNYLVCYHPHSLYGIMYNMYTSKLHHEQGFLPLFTGADVVFKIPILRRMLVAWGNTPVSSQALLKNLKLGYPHNILTLMPGGISEMFYGLEKEQIILKKRKGFARIALKSGVDLVPAYAFGANRAWTRYFGHESLAFKLSNKLRMSLVVWTGRWGIPFGCIPHKQPMVIALGPAIEVTKIEGREPTDAEVDALHGTYCKALRELFDRHKHKVGWEKEELYFEDGDVIRAKID